MKTRNTVLIGALLLIGGLVQGQEESGVVELAEVPVEYEKSALFTSLDFGSNGSNHAANLDCTTIGTLERKNASLLDLGFVFNPSSEKMLSLFRHRQSFTWIL